MWLCPPEATRHKKGGSSLASLRYPEAMCPRKWCTGTRGRPVAKDSPLAKFTPTSSAPMSPGA